MLDWSGLLLVEPVLAPVPPDLLGAVVHDVGVGEALHVAGRRSQVGVDVPGGGGDIRRRELLVVSDVGRGPGGLTSPLQLTQSVLQSTYAGYAGELGNNKMKSLHSLSLQFRNSNISHSYTYILPSWINAIYDGSLADEFH